jgi:hypothetical protein
LIATLAENLSVLDSRIQKLSATVAELVEIVRATENSNIGNVKGK